MRLGYDALEVYRISPRLFRGSLINEILVKAVLNIFRNRKLGKLLSQRRERLYRLANSWCHDAMLADDLVQDTLRKALQKADQLNDESKLDAWLFRILHNTWMAYLRKNKPTLDFDEEASQEISTPESLLSDQERCERVRVAIARLPISQRSVISLVDIEGCRYHEVSEILDIPIGTVMSRLNRARAALKKQLIGIRQDTSLSQKQDYLRRVK